MEDVFEKLQIEYLPPKNLDPNDYNPNRLTDEEFELLLRSIEEDGFTQPIVINQDDVIVDGEHRWRAATTLGIALIPCVRVTLTPEQMQIATLRYNKARGHHQEDLEAAILEELIAMGEVDWVADSLMVADAELDALLEGELGLYMGEELVIQVDDVDIESSDPFEHTNMSPYPLVTLDDDDGLIVSYDLGIPGEPSVQRYQIIVGFTHADGYIVRHALGSAPIPSVMQLCRRKL